MSTPKPTDTSPPLFVAGLPESRVSRRLGPYAVACALGLALATFIIFAGFTPIKPTNTIVLTLLGGDGGVIVVLLLLIALEIAKLRAARKIARAGSRLHTRLVLLFSLLAAIPALFTATIATVSVEWAINPAFMRNVAGFIDDSGAAVQAYRQSQCQALLRDADIAAADLSSAASFFGTHSPFLPQYLNARAKAFDFTIAALMNEGGQILAANSRRDLLTKPNARDFADARTHHPICGLLADGGAFLVLRPIEALPHTYLYVGRTLDPLIHRVGNEGAQFSTAFTHFEAHRHNIELGFAAIFLMLTLTLLISAVWTGLTFANRLVSPIRRLIRAADMVALGDFSVRVPTRKADGDIAHLGQTFNKMTADLSQQRESLIIANSLNEERRAFIEATLAGVPMGIIGVDKEDKIIICNAAAEALLTTPLMGQKLAQVSPILAPLLAEATGAQTHQAQITFISKGRERMLNVRITGNPLRPELGRVVTLDDITELVTAQRASAWADVARRIAHEIKNPLTPIQLSAERLRRRYGRLILEGKDIFDQCIDTIVRQVDDIQRMVDEFSNFARMPRAKLLPDDLAECIRQALFLARVGRADLVFEDNLPPTPLIIPFDRRLISQALTNILKNAGEGIDALANPATQGRIQVSLTIGEGSAHISVSDNGKGFPITNRHTLTEPYITTRAEGTGLGLPIVIKIFEDHHGRVELLDGLLREDGGKGARVLMTLPLPTAS